MSSDIDNPEFCDGINNPSPAARHASPYTRGEQLQRLVWGILQITMFRYSPRQFWELRCWLLRLFGARIGKEVHIYNTATVFCPWLLKIGDHSAVGDGAILYDLGALAIGCRVTISQRAHLCGGTHNYRDANMSLIRCPIEIGDDAWICAEAFVGPNVTIGEGAIVGARGVVVRDVPAWTVVCGNPAKVTKHRDRLAFQALKDEAGEMR